MFAKQFYLQIGKNTLHIHEETTKLLEFALYLEPVSILSLERSKLRIF